MTDLNATAIIGVLNRHRVKFVVIGAFAAIAQHAPIPATRDIDLTPGSSLDNLARLSAALKKLGARVRTDAADEGLPFDHDGQCLAAAPVWNLICPFGEFDISFAPSGIAGGYDELVARAHRMRVDAVDVMVADLSDVIRSKEAAGRPKDLQVLPILYRFDRQRRGSEPTPIAGLATGQDPVRGRPR
jgi:hypothetical protein